MADGDKRLEDLKKLITEIEKSLKTLGQPESNFYENLFESLKKSIDPASDLNKAYEKGEDLLKRIKKDISDVNDELGYTFSSFNKIVNELTKNKNITSEINKSTKSLTGIAGELVNRQKEIVNLSSKELEKLKEKASKDFENLKNQKAFLDDKKKLTIQEEIALSSISDILSENTGLQASFTRQLEASIKEQKSIENSLGVTGALLKGITEIPGLKEFGQYFKLDEANKSMEKYSKTLIDNLKNSPEYVSLFTSINKEIQNAEGNLNDLGEELKRLTSEKESLSLKVVDEKEIEKQIESVKSKIKAFEEEKIKLASTGDMGSEKYNDITKEIEKQKKEQTKLNNLLQDSIDSTKEIKEINKEIKKIKKDESDQVKNLNEKVAERAELEAKVTEQAIGGLGARFKILGKGLSEAVGGAVKLLKDPAFYLTAFITALASADKRIGEIAKSMGTSYSEASKLSSRFNEIANASGNTFISTADIQKSFIELNKQFGTTAAFSNEMLKDFSELTQIAGYTNEAAGKLSKITAATGGDLSENTSQILGQAVAFNAVNKLALNEKEIVEGVGKASASVTLSLGMQPGRIAQAVMQAKALGMELGKVESIAQSLLNFESSISSELEAELLTGRQLNLEQARYYALTNNIAGVAEEVSKQIGSASDFTEMNVIQQEALAKAVGMTREDLANSLIEREALAKLGGQDKTSLEAYNRLKKEGLSDDQIALKLGDEKLASQLKSQSAQDRFAKSIEKLQDIFVTLVDPLMPVLDAFTSILTPIGWMLKGLGKIPGLMQAIVAGTIAWKVASSGILANFTRINLAKKIGLITDKQAILIQKASNMMAKESIVTSKSINFYKNQTLGATIKNNIQEGISAAKTKINIGLETLRAKKKSLVAAAENKIGFAAIKTRMKQLSGFLVDVGRYALKAGSAVAGIPVIGPVLAVGAIAAALAGGMALYSKAKGNDIISKGGSGAGYGKRTLLFPEDKIALDLNNKDTILAGTDLLGEKKNQNLVSPKITPPSPQIVIPKPQAPQVDVSLLAEKLDALNKTNTLLTQIAKKDTNVSLDGTKVSKGVALSESTLG